MEAEKRIRREIANSNERRRMQSINAGFQSLRTLLPRHEGEKLSKAAILQQTAEYIYSLEQEKTRLLSQNCQLKRLLNQHEGGEIPFKKRKTDVMLTTTIIPDSTDEKSVSPEPTALIKKEIKDSLETCELRSQLDRERRARAALEERVRALEFDRHYRVKSDPDTPLPVALLEITQQVVPTQKVSPTLSTPPQPAVLPLKSTAVVANITPPPPANTPAAVLVEEIKAEPTLIEVVSNIEPQVDVEAVDPSRLYLASTSRQNLETIVEAIRHLEGDHLFAEDTPLALTTKPPPQPTHYHQRPGVIFVKHS